ncbi:MAG: twin-arginine translocase subunit TatC [Candidatus Thermoplasmatota archaeon]|nr:twin-arginine translocase subunit TatC [Candidatus Thermoplasmatota archaeon]
MDRDAWVTAAESVQRHVVLHLLVAGALFLGMFELSPALLTELRDRLLPQDATLVYLSPAEYMLLRFRLAGYAAICGLALTTGIDVWSTLRGRLTMDRPGIGSVATVLLAALALFAVGVAYAQLLMLPLVLEYLHGDAAAAGFASTYSLSAFYSFVLLLTVSLGIAFELPLVVLLLLRLELATVPQLAHYRRHLIVAFFVLAAFITPPDVISQFLLAVPLLLLFELSLVVGRFAGKG